MYKYCFLFFGVLVYSCKQPAAPVLFAEMKETGIQFTNAIKETKEFNVFKYRNFYNGGGVATGDLNNDGLADVFFTSNQGPNKLYLNKGNFSFEDISAKAGFGDKKQWSTGVVFADVNADGWLDIYVCNAGSMFDTTLRRNQLFINNKNLTFTESAAAYGLDNSGYSTQASFFDYDMDGDLDCFLVNNSPIPVNALNHANNRDLKDGEWEVADFLKGGGDHLYRNDNGAFREVSKEAGIHGSLISLGLGVTVSDFNMDGWPDVYVSNDFFERDYLYINQHNGSFKDELETRMQHTSYSSMGADVQDINNDGFPDLFTTDMLPSDDRRLKANTSFDNYDQFHLKQTRGFYNQFTQNALQVNTGNGHFYETAFYSGVAASDWSWGALLFDADNDGLNDILVCNGIYRDVTDQDFIDFFANDVVQQMVMKGQKEEVNNVIDKMPSNPIANKLFHNKGNLQFEDAGEQWGLTQTTFSNGAAYADFDNDGDLDMIINNVNQPALVYKNNSREQNHHNYIAVNLAYKKPNPFGIGATIKVFQGNQVFSREQMPSRGFQSSVEYKQVIGLGNAGADSVVVLWPDGTSSHISKPSLNTVIKISYDSQQVTKALVQPAVQTIFDSLPVIFDKHTEDDFVDFYYERNIPFMLSRQGPKAATADVNGDGLTDIFIGGAKGQASQLYLQSAGGFVKKETPDFKTFSFNDVTAAVFFDCDKDGDMDLFAGGGGNFTAETQGNYQNLLYINDGKGNFSLKRGALPLSTANCGAVLAFDYDKDGFMDLFTGSRSVPQQYGKTPRNYLLHNDGSGHFEDVTDKQAPAMKNTGMITGAAAADINNDKKEELVLTGEWMSPAVFAFNGTQFTAVKTGLENYYGWWQTVKLADIDNDGDMDMVLGNMGDNFYLRADENTPVKIWMKDFDENGTPDKIFTKTVNGKDIPVFMKREITDQLPSLKKLNLRHHEYAEKTVQEIFGTDINDAEQKKVNYTKSIVALNDGKGNFSPVALPYQAQLSAINAVAITDIDHDGLPDIITAGNCINVLPQFGSEDASYGLVLLNKGKGVFTAVPGTVSGLYLRGETRDISLVGTPGYSAVLFLQNNSFPALYKINDRQTAPAK